MAEAHDGGCLCGSVRYRVTGVPLLTNVCHCTFCQRRTGSAFGFVAYFKQEEVEIRGSLKTYEHRSDESNRWLHVGFCPTCGTTVTLTVEVLPGACGIAGGTFDEPSWLKVDRFSWMRSAHPWVIAPPGVAQFQKSSLKSS
jgi:hypothetical protein